MTSPIVIVNTATGSDTLSSGAGPTVALNGSGAALSGVVTVDLSADSPDLTGVATDGSAVLWVETSTGRQFSEIASVDDGTKIVTVVTTYSVTESSRNWAIGGKRATIDDTNTRAYFMDALAKWTLEIEDDQTVTSTITIGFSSLNEPNEIRGATKHVTISANYDNYTFNHNSNTGVTRWRNLRFINTAGTKNTSTAIRSAALNSNFILQDCIIGGTGGLGFNQGIRILAATSIECAFYNCDFIGCTYGLEAYYNGPFIYNCYFAENTQDGCIVKQAREAVFAINSIFVNNGGWGFTTDGLNSAYAFSVINCTFDNNTLGGLNVRNFMRDDACRLRIHNNQFTNNGVYGAGFETDNWDGWRQQIDFNNYYNNASGAYDTTYFNGGPNDLALDPQYVNAPSGNYAIGTPTSEQGVPRGNTIGAGVTCNTLTYLDIGASQRPRLSFGPQINGISTVVYA